MSVESNGGQDDAPSGLADADAASPAAAWGVDHAQAAAQAGGSLLSPSAPTVHFTTAQAAVQLTRDNLFWGATLGAAYGPLTFGFRTVAPSYSVEDVDVQGTFTPFTAAEKAAARAALGLWAAAANISFVDLGDSNSATIQFSNYSSTTDSAEAFAYFPGNPSPNSRAGDVFVNTYYASTTNLAPGTYEFNTLIHEIGHTLGLEHPADYDASDETAPTYTNSAIYIEDSRMYTVMSYFGSTNTGGSLSVFAETPQMHDVAAIQRLYGANTTTRTGDTTYGFGSNAGSPYLISAATQHVAFSIYDAGGNDTLNASGYGQAQTLDLRSESFSSLGGDTFNVSIAQNVVIENAVGGSGRDTLTGNDANNRLDGGPGDDVISGGLGADTLVGGAGADRFAFHAASESVQSAYDVITDFSSAIDKIDFSDLTGLQSIAVVASPAGAVVFASTTAGQLQVGVSSAVQGGDFLFPLSAPASFGVDLVGDARDNVLIGSSGNDLLFGLEGSDRLEGGSGDDQLFGDAGADVLVGGAGADRFSYRGPADSNIGGYDIITDFVSGTDKIDFYYLNGVTTISLVRSEGGTFVFAATSSGQVQIGFTGAVQGSDILNPYGTAPAFGYIITGEARTDTLIGSAGADQLAGLAGDDQLFGGGGADRLFGGDGADLFGYTAASDSPLAAFDRIFDFQSGVDKVDLRAVHTGAADRYGLVVQGGDEFLFVDQGGDGISDMLIVFSGVTNVQASDILF